MMKLGNTVPSASRFRVWGKARAISSARASPSRTTMMSGGVSARASVGSTGSKHSRARSSAHRDLHVET